MTEDAGVGSTVSGARSGEPPTRAQGQPPQKMLGYSTPATAPPIAGPAKYTHQSATLPPTAAGPMKRAGLSATPVRGPKARIIEARTNPIARPPRRGPRSSMPVPQMVRTRKNVSTASINNPFPTDTLSDGAP